jgi:hypothetical protein
MSSSPDMKFRVCQPSRRAYSKQNDGLGANSKPARVKPSAGFKPLVRWVPIIIWMVVILSFGITLYVKAGENEPVYPKKFLEAASAFTNAPATNRYIEASNLIELLPVAPVTKSEAHTNSFGRGSTFETRDENKPSFFLTQREVVRLLGAPWITNSISYSYLVKKDADSGAALMVRFHNGYVVYSTIYGGKYH